MKTPALSNKQATLWYADAAASGYNILDMTGTVICSLTGPRSLDSDVAREAELVADAFNTHQSTGMLPSELATQRDQLLKALRPFADMEMTVEDFHAAQAVVASAKV